LTSCFLSATRPRKISKDLERSRMSSAMLSCCPMSLGHVTCHIMSHHVTKNHLMSHFIVFDYETPKRQFHTQTIHGAAIYGAPWIPSIDPLYVSIYYIYIQHQPDPMGMKFHLALASASGVAHSGLAGGGL
jgi:hypothetical protein